MENRKLKEKINQTSGMDKQTKYLSPLWHNRNEWIRNFLNRCLLVPKVFNKIFRYLKDAKVQKVVQLTTIHSWDFHSRAK